MQIGTIEAEKEEPIVKRRLSRGSGSGPSGGKGGGGDKGNENGGGGSRPPSFPSDDQDHPVQDKTQIITAVLLLVVLMTFGGLIGAYVVLATNRALEWTPFDIPYQIWFSTALLVGSSITYEIAKRAIFEDHWGTAKRFLLATTVLGGIFVSSQLVVWLTLVGRGLYMRGNPYAGFFYILTAAHAVHVIGGIIALGAVLLRNWYPTIHEPELEYRRNLARSVGWYWHFMGILWICIFALLGLWK